MVVQRRNFKTEWAEIQLRALESTVSNFRSKPFDVYRVTLHDDLQRGLFRIQVESIGAIDAIRIGLLAGDFIHNLRSSLDHLAWTLAEVGKKRPSSENCFPIVGLAKMTPRAQVKIDERIAACTAGWPSGAVSVVKSFQPYHDGSAYKSNHLWRLNFLWNLDKHRNIALHTVDSDVLFKVPTGIPVDEQKFDDGAIVSVPLSAKDKVRFNPAPNVQIFFGDEQRGVKVTIQDLRDIYEFVSGKVAPPLMSFLP